MKNVMKYSVVNVVSCALGVIENNGFVSKKEATVDKPSTASIIQQQLLNLDASEFSEVYQGFFAEAVELIEWAKENLKGDFGRSTIEIINKGEITLPQVAFLATLPNQKKIVDEREAVREEQAKETASSEWFGTVRKRSEFFVKLVQKKYVPNYDSYIYNITTREGNLGSFFSKNDFELTAGDCFLMKATPKRHVVSSWHGGKETQFNRVVIKEIMGKVNK
jgi:hypothetical protein